MRQLKESAKILILNNSLCGEDRKVLSILFIISSLILFPLLVAWEMKRFPSKEPSLGLLELCLESSQNTILTAHQPKSDTKVSLHLLYSSK